jgi:hypothetical protein
VGFWVTFTFTVGVVGSDVARASEPSAASSEGPRGAAAVSVTPKDSSDSLAAPESASHSARSRELLGANCSFTTGTMARRVLEEGAAWTWVGTLAQTDNAQPTRIATPYRADEGVFLVGTELLETLVQKGLSAANLRLEGRSLELEGVRYVVLTAFARVDT